MIALYKGTSWLSKLIRWRSWDEHSHASYVCQDGDNIEAWIPEGVRCTKSIFTGHSKGTKIDLYEIKLTDEEKTGIEVFLMKQLGKKYDYMGILAFATRISGQHQNKWFCSELVCAAFNSIGKPLLERIPPCKVFPGMIAYSPLLKFVKTVTVP